MFLFSADKKLVPFLYFAGNKFLRLICKKQPKLQIVISLKNRAEFFPKLIKIYNFGKTQTAQIFDYLLIINHLTQINKY